jgi:hypothetical protein
VNNGTKKDYNKRMRNGIITKEQLIGLCISVDLVDDVSKISSKRNMDDTSLSLFLFIEIANADIYLKNSLSIFFLGNGI